jgi:hypothetical protein
MGHRREVLNRFAVTTCPFVADPSVMDRVYVAFIDVEDARIVVYGLLVLAHLGEAVGAVVQGLDVVRLSELQFIVIVLDGFFIPFDFAVYQASV